MVVSSRRVAPGTMTRGAAALSLLLVSCHEGTLGRRTGSVPVDAASDTRAPQPPHGDASGGAGGAQGGSPPDADPRDVGPPDAEPSDADARDVGPPDAEPSEVGPPDAELVDPPDAPPPEAAPDVPPPPVELCNFIDDDGDGIVDEGFPWASGPWVKVLDTTFNAVYIQAVTLVDGRVAVAGMDSYGEGSDRGYILVLAEDGTVAAGPVWTDILAPGGDFTAITEGANGDIAAIYSSTDYAGCAVGCPVHFTRVRGSDLSVLESHPLALPFSARSAFGLAYSQDTYATFVRDLAHGAHLVGFRSATPSDAGWPAVTDHVLPTTGTNLGGAVAAGSSGAAWAQAERTGTDTSRLGVGVYSWDGMREVLADLTIATGGQPYVTVSANGRSLARLGADYVLAYSETVPVYQTQVTRFTERGEIVALPRPVGPAGDAPSDVLLMGSTLLVATIDTQAASELKIHRLGTGLDPAPGSSAPTIVPVNGTQYVTIARAGAGLLVIAGNSAQRAVEVARVGCP